MKDGFTKQWIISKSIDIISRYEPGILTLRALHYQLVSLGMTNDLNHYKRVVNAMSDARWDEMIDFEAFSDLDRAMIGETAYQEVSLDKHTETAKEQVQLWMQNYRLNRWSNQPKYVEVLIEKKALQGVFQGPCRNHHVGLGACKGYPSLTFLYEMAQRLLEVESEGKEITIIYFGDYDPSGEDIPRSMKENLSRFNVDVEIDRIALNYQQVIEWNLPPAPTKMTDTRSKWWDGIGQVELDAIPPTRLQNMCSRAIEKYFDDNLYEELLDREREEGEQFRSAMRDFTNELLG